jgi:hypothetical protein
MAHQESWRRGIGVVQRNVLYSRENARVWLVQALRALTI